MDITQALEQSRPGMVGDVQAAIRKRQLNQRAEQTYLHWISRFVLFHDLKDPAHLAAEDQLLFLDYLSNKIHHARTLSADIAFGGLLVKGVEFQFQLVGRFEIAFRRLDVVYRFFEFCFQVTHVVSPWCWWFFSVQTCWQYSDGGGWRH